MSNDNLTQQLKTDLQNAQATCDFLQIKVQELIDDVQDQIKENYKLKAELNLLLQSADALDKTNR